MKVTRSQRVWLGVLGAAVVGLGIDRFVGGGEATPAAVAVVAAVPALMPASASANVPASARHAVVPSGPVEAALSAFDGSLAARLTDLHHGRGLGGPVRDAFTPSPAWISDTGGDRQSGSDAERVAAFQRSHVLKGIVRQGAFGQALLDTNLVPVGQTIDGFRLASVDRLRAVFVSGDARVELPLPDGKSTAAPGR